MRTAAVAQPAVAVAAAAPFAPLSLRLKTLPPAPQLILNSHEDVQFVSDDEAEQFKCDLCTSVAFHPPNQTCGHLHCHSCLERSRMNMNRCPSCRQRLEEHLQTNGFAQRLIMQLKVRCTNVENGCPWQGEMGTYHRNLNNHHLACGFRNVNCPACDQSVLVRDVPTHPNECPARPIRCTHCHREMKFSEYADHHTIEMYDFDTAYPPCKGFQACPNGCLDIDGRVSLIIIDQLEAHLAVCHRRPVECPCCDPSVAAAVPHCDLTNHIKSKFSDPSQQDRIAARLFTLTMDKQKVEDEHKRLTDVHAAAQIELQAYADAKLRLRVGNLCDCRDTDKQWCLAEIIETDDTRYKVHYIDLSHRVSTMRARNKSAVFVSILLQESN